MRKFCLLFTAFLMAAIAVPAQTAGTIRVLIIENKNPITIQTSGPVEIQDSVKNTKYKTQRGGTFKIIRNNNTITVGNLSTNQGAIIIPQGKTIFTINNNKYEGTLIAKPTAQGINLIEEIPLQNYLYGVLPYEMSASWPIEALKAQAVTARTYTLRGIETKTAGDFDLYSDVRSQMYKGSVKLYDNVKKAVEETSGEVLKYDDKMFFTYYHANCGGHTDEIPWLSEVPKPLQGAKCGYCGHSKSANWQYTITKDAINKYLKQQKIAGTIKSIKIGKKHSSGRAKTLLLNTTKGKFYTPCNTFRIGVGSTKFKSCFIKSIKGFEFKGKGYGHGGGMCQDGANGMAVDGKDYKDILKRYYPGAKLTAI